MAVHPDPDRSHQIRRLFRRGMSVEAATRAVDADRVTLSLLDHLVGGAREHTRAEAAARAGVPEAVAEAVERAIGAAADGRWSDSDIRHLSLVGRLLQLLPPEVVLDTIRAEVPVLRTMALRTLDLAERLFLDDVQRDGDDPVEQALALHRAAGPLLDVSTELVGQSYRRILLHMLTSELVVQAMRAEGETVDVAVGFVDVVGYTSLSARIDPTGLGDVLTAFEHSCLELVEDHPGIQLVKFLGDAAMFVALDAVELVGAVHDLVQPIEDADQALGYAPIRGGVSHGPVLLRAGDYYGSPVNEAARLTDLARRNTILVADHLKEDLREAFKLRRIRPVLLHGIGMRRPHAVRERRSER